MKHDLKELRKSQEKCYKAKAEELRTMESEVAQKQRMVELRGGYQGVLRGAQHPKTSLRGC